MQNSSHKSSPITIYFQIQCRNCTIFFFLDVPRLPVLEQPVEEPQEKEEEPEQEQPKEKKNRKTSGPKVVDPYETDDSSYLYPVLIALGLFIPSVLCLCKL